jgi:ubiquinone/menaquinone biosynthesis C-methylase UbiE
MGHAVHHSLRASTLDWDHNAYYQRLLLRHLPRPCNRVLDAGCGAGAFAVELAKRARHVDAPDRSPAMIEEARRVAPPNVTCIWADLLQEPLPDAGYDAIVSSAPYITHLFQESCPVWPERCAQAVSWRP